MQPPSLSFPSKSDTPSISPMLFSVKYVIKNELDFKSDCVLLGPSRFSNTL